MFLRRKKREDVEEEELVGSEVVDNGRTSKDGSTENAAVPSSSKNSEGELEEERNDFNFSMGGVRKGKDEINTSVDERGLTEDSLTARRQSDESVLRHLADDKAPENDSMRDKLRTMMGARKKLDAELADLAEDARRAGIKRATIAGEKSTSIPKLHETHIDVYDATLESSVRLSYETSGVEDGDPLEKGLVQIPAGVQSKKNEQTGIESSKNAVKESDTQSISNDDGSFIIPYFSGRKPDSSEKTSVCNKYSLQVPLCCGGTGSPWTKPEPEKKEKVLSYFEDEEKDSMKNAESSETLTPDTSDLHEKNWNDQGSGPKDGELLMMNNVAKNPTYGDDIGDYAKGKKEADEMTIKTNGDDATNRTFGDYATNGIYGDDATNRTDGDNATNRTYGDDATNRTYGDDATNRTYGDNATNTNRTYGDDATNRTYGDDATNRTYGDDATNRTYGDDATNRTFGDDATNRTYGDGKTPGDDATNKSFGYDTTNKSFGEDATNVTFGEDATNVTVGDEATNVTVGDEATNVTVGDDATNQTYREEASNRTYRDDATNTTYREFRDDATNTTYRDDATNTTFRDDATLLNLDSSDKAMGMEHSVQIVDKIYANDQGNSEAEEVDSVVDRLLEDFEDHDDAFEDVGNDEDGYNLIGGERTYSSSRLREDYGYSEDYTSEIEVADIDGFSVIQLGGREEKLKLVNSEDNQLERTNEAVEQRGSSEKRDKSKLKRVLFGKETRRRSLRQKGKGRSKSKSKNKQALLRQCPPSQPPDGERAVAAVKKYGLAKPGNPESRRRSHDTVMKPSRMRRVVSKGKETSLDFF